MHVRKLLLSFFGLFLLTGCGATPLPEHPTLGDLAPVQMTVYSDYKCAYCHDFAINILPQLKTEFIDTGRVQLTYHEFPMLNEDSWKFATLSRCLYQTSPEQFWDAQRALFGVSNIYDETRIGDILQNLSINPERINACTEDPATEAAIVSDKRAAEARGVKGTPTFIIGSQQVSGLLQYKFFKKAIELEITKATATMEE